MNGEKVKHLVINGETFDKNVFGLKCNVTKEMFSSASLDSQGNVVISSLPIAYLETFDKAHGPYIVCAETKKAYYLACNGISASDHGGWVDKKYVELVVDD